MQIPIKFWHSHKITYHGTFQKHAYRLLDHSELNKRLYINIVVMMLKS